MTQALWRNLEDLARRNSSGDRAALLQRLADLLMRGNISRDAMIVDLFEDIVCRVLDQVNPKEKIEFAERVGPEALTPRRVVMELANDIVSVAEPVLRYSPNLSEKDLIDIAENTGPAHLEVIARRIFLSRDLTDILVARGQMMVHRAIAANDGAQISDGAFHVLLDGAQGDTVLQELMALRPNLPQAVRDRLVPILAQEVRRCLSSRWSSIPAAKISNALDAEVEQLIERVEAISDDHAAFVNLQAGIEDGVLTLDEAIRQACRLNRHDWLIDLVAAAGSSERSSVLTVLLMRENRPLTVMLRALGISGESFRAVLDMRARHLRVGSNDPRLVVEYEALDPGAAAAILRKHHGNPMLVPTRA